MQSHDDEDAKDPRRRAMRAVFEYVAAHPGATGAEVWRDVEHGFFPCGREDAETMWNPDDIRTPDEEAAPPTLEAVPQWVLATIVIVAELREPPKTFEAVFNVTEPMTAAGARLVDPMVIGSNDDSLANHPRTWVLSEPAQRLKSLMLKAQVPMQRSLTKMCVGATGKPVMVYVEPADDGFVVMRYAAVSEEDVRMIAPEPPPPEPLRMPPPPSPAIPREPPREAAAPITRPVVQAVQRRPTQVLQAAQRLCPTCARMIDRAVFLDHLEEHDREAAQ